MDLENWQSEQAKVSLPRSLKPAIVAALMATMAAWRACPARAATYYWDANGAAAGWGTYNSGAWGAASFWTTDSTGGFAGGGIVLPSLADDVCFGSVSLAYANGAGPAVSGTVYANSVTIRMSGSNSFSLNGGTITLGGGGFTIANSNNGTNDQFGMGSAWVLAAGAGVATCFINNDKQDYYQGGLTFGGSITGTSDLVIQANDIPDSGVTGFNFSDTGTGLDVAGSVVNSGTGANLKGFATHVTIARLGAGVTAVAQDSASSALAIDSFAAGFAGPLAVRSGILRVGRSLYGGSVTNITPARVTVGAGGTFALRAGGSGYSVADIAGILTQLGGTVSAGGFQAGACVGIDTTLGSITYSGSIADSANGSLGLTVLGAANTLTLSGNNSYSGLTRLVKGTLQVNSAGALGGGGNLTFGMPAFNFAGYGQGRTPPSGNTTQCALQFGPGAGGAVFSNNVVNSMRAMTFDTNGQNVTLAGAIDGTNVGDGYASTIQPAQLVKVGAGTLTLSGANAYTGRTRVTAGTLSVASFNYVAAGNWPTHAASSLGAPTLAANGTIDMGSTTTAGQLTYTGAGETTDRVINLAGTTGGATLDQSGSGRLKFASAFTATGGGAKTLTLQGSTAGAGEIAAAIVDNSAANKTSVVKTGTSTWALSGTNTYTGTTTVNAGTLDLGAAGSINASATWTIAAGAKLTAGHDLALGSSRTLAIGFSDAAAGQLRVTGKATLAGATLNVSGMPTNGVFYTLVARDGVYAGDTFKGLADGDPITVGGIPCVIVYGGGDGNDVVVFEPVSGDAEVPAIHDLPANAIQGVSPGRTSAEVTWTPPTASDNIGVVSFTSTWKSGDTFPEGDTTVTYTAVDAAGNRTTASFTVTVTPEPQADGVWNTTLNNAHWNAPTNWIDSRIAFGSGRTAYFNALDVTSDTAVRLDSSRTIGRLVFGDTNTATAAGWALDNGGAAGNALVLAGSAPTLEVETLGAGKSATIAAVIAGTNGLTKTGPGTLTFTKANTYSGGTVVNGGTLYMGINNNAVLGVVPGSFAPNNVVLDGGTLDGTVDFAYDSSSQRQLVLGPGGGTFGSAMYCWPGQISGSGNLTIKCGGFRMNGAGGGGTGPYDNTYTGDTIPLAGGSVSPFRALSLQYSTVDLTYQANGVVGSGRSTYLVLGGLKGTQNWALPTYAGGIHIGNNNKDTTYSGVMSGSGAPILKIGAGTLTLGGANTYSGPTTVSAGVLALGADGSINNSASLRIAAGAALDATAKTTFALRAGQSVTLDVDPAGAGAAGRIRAAELDITSGSVTLNFLGGLRHKVYVLAEYTLLTGAAFASVSEVPNRYSLVYNYGGRQIAIVRSDALLLLVR